MKYFSLFLLLFFTHTVSVAQLTVDVKNTSAIDRHDESIVVDWSAIVAKLPDVHSVVVLDRAGRIIPSQVLFEGKSKPQSLLFQVNIKARARSIYRIVDTLPYLYDTLTYGRLVPERKDDFAWENNRVAYRMYGPALEASGEISSGIDLWLKRTPDMVINHWYKRGYDYHSDQGEGLDCYKVGASLGCGAIAPIVGGKLRMARNFTRAELLDSGPLRTAFRLHYAPLNLDGIEVVQSLDISLDAHENLNTISVVYHGLFDTLSVAAGIVLRDPTSDQIIDRPRAVSYIQPMGGDNGTAYLAVITNLGSASEQIDGHLTKRSPIRPGERYTYRSGGYWNRFGVPSLDDWCRILDIEVERFSHPLLVKVR